MPPRRTARRGRALLPRIARTALLLVAVCLLLHWACSGMYGLSAPQRVLVLTAHPDDEVMFFGPSILGLGQRGAHLSAVCVSIGDADGLGAVRAEELKRSYAKLGVPSDRVQSWNDTRLQDGFAQLWDPDYIAQRLAPSACSTRPDALLTFDAGGVSLHPNHRAMFQAALALQQGWIQLCGRPHSAAPAVLALHTLSWRIKYFGLVASTAQFLAHQAGLGSQRELLFLSPPQAYPHIVDAMREHASQWVWFRYLYLGFSSYLHGNALTQFDP